MADRKIKKTILAINDKFNPDISRKILKDLCNKINNKMTTPSEKNRLDNIIRMI